MKSVVTPKLMDFDSLLKLLDDNFGDNLFPSFSYEDAAVILFIKPIYPHWIFQMFSNYQKDLSRYINYKLSCICNENCHRKNQGNKY